MRASASLNHVYRLVWNVGRQMWMPLPEISRGRGKAGRSVVIGALALAGAAAQAGALPTGGQIVSGSGSIQQAGTTLTVQQNTSKLITNWQSFGIGSGDSVIFRQPLSSSIALNRVLGNDPSQIFGNLIANGQIFLINPNGVLFAPGSSVNVGGLVASTLALSNSDFLGGNYHFTAANNPVSVVNQGSLHAADGGVVALLGGSVTNQGTIQANLGTVALGAGKDISLDFAGDGLLNLTVNQATAQSLVANGNLVQADGGHVVMSAGAADAVIAGVVNNTGVVQAQTLENQSGHILLTGGTVNIGGTLDASAPKGGDGGFIETSGAQVKVADGALVTTKSTQGNTGQWLIDPKDFTIAASGGDETGAQVSTALTSNNVTIASSNGATSGTGNINVDDAISWDAGTKLTLKAANDINVNSAITASGNHAGVVLNYGGYTNSGSTVTPGTGYFINAPITLSGNNPLFESNGTTYTVIQDVDALQAMGSNLPANYVLGENIDATATSSWNAGAGFVPVGTSTTNFAGIFDGLGHTISNLTINTPGQGNVGLFGYTGSSAIIRNVGLVGGSVTGAEYVGGLVGFNDGSISDAYATGSFSGSQIVGGLVGDNQSDGSISNSYAGGNVTGDDVVGGLVGVNVGRIGEVYATSNVSSNLFFGAGGLVGENNFGGTINQAYASGKVVGSGTSDSAGGLVGANEGSISNAYWDSFTTGQSSATGAVSGSSFAVAAVTADPTQSTASNYAFSASAYGNLGSGWYLANGLRPLLTSQYSTTITNVDQLQLMAMNLSANYVLANDIDASATAGTNRSGIWDTTGFIPVGTGTATFTGTFNGQGDTISNLTINDGSAFNFVGLFGGTSASAAISNVGLIGASVSGNTYVGALVGGNGSGTSISNAYATGTVLGNLDVGGLVGGNSGSISGVYATASVSGNTNVGGLVGDNQGSITNAYATGTVDGEGYIGGLVGFNEASGSISYAYATGGISALADTGGLVGVSNGSVSSSYWNTTQTPGLSGVGSGSGTGATGLTTAQMEQASSFVGWSLDSVGGANDTWRIYQGNTMPLLKVFLTPLSLLPGAGSTTTYNGATQSLTDSVASVLPTGANVALVLGSGPTASGANAGSYALGDSNLYSTQQGYDLIAPASPGALVINPAVLSLSGTETYNGTMTVQAGAFDPSGTIIGVDGETLTLTGTGTASNANVGSNRAVNPGGLSLGNGSGLANNYTLTGGTDKVNITPAVISLNGTETYNGTTTVQASTFDPSGAVAGVNGETLKLTGTGTASSANVGNNLSVNPSGLSLANGGGATGGKASNYTLVGGTDTVDITPAVINLSGTEIYNGTTTVLAGTFDPSGTILGMDGETLTLTGTGTASNANVGSNRSVDPSGLSLGNGSGLASNYTLTGGTDKVSITPAVISLNGTETYNGTTTVQANVFDPSGAITGVDGQMLTLTGTGAASSANVGTGLSVDPGGLSLGNGGGATGGRASNYTLVGGTDTVSITPAVINLSGTEMYNGTTTVQAGAFDPSGTITGVDGETLTLTGTGTAASANVGSNRAVNPGGLSLGNGSGLANNYTLTGGTDTVSITPAVISLSGTEVYNGTTTVQASVFDPSGMITGVDGQMLTLTGTGAASSANVGTGLSVDPGGLSLGNGTGLASNYTLTGGTDTVDITPASLTITALTNTKVYDGTTSAAKTPTVMGLIAADPLTSLSESYGSANVMGTNGSTLIPNYVFSNPGNYTVRLVDAMGTITPAPLTITANNLTVPFAPLQFFGFHGGNGVTYAGFVDGQNASVLGGALTYSGSSQGAYLPLLTYAITPGGLTSTNYAITWVSGQLKITTAVCLISCI